MYYVGRHVYVAEAKYTCTCAAIHGRKSRIRCVRAEEMESDRRSQMEDGELCIRVQKTERARLFLLQCIFLKRNIYYVFYLLYEKYTRDSLLRDEYVICGHLITIKRLGLIKHTTP